MSASSHSKLSPLSSRDLCGYSLHFCHQLAITFVSTDPNAIRPTPSANFEYHKLKSPSGLNRELAADVHPLYVSERNFAFLRSRVEDDLIIIEHEFSIAINVQEQCHERQEEEYDENEHNRVIEYKTELIFYKASPDSRVQYEHREIDQRLLIVKVEFVFKFFLHCFRT